MFYILANEFVFYRSYRLLYITMFFLWRMVLVADMSVPCVATSNFICISEDLLLYCTQMFYICIEMLYVIYVLLCG